MATDEIGRSLPTRLARRRLLAGRLIAGMVSFNFALALIGGWLLSGPAAWLTRFGLGFWGWTGALLAASALLAVPVAGAAAFRLLHPPPGEDAGT